MVQKKKKWQKRIKRSAGIKEALNTQRELHNIKHVTSPQQDGSSQSVTEVYHDIYKGLNRLNHLADDMTFYIQHMK